MSDGKFIPKPTADGSYTFFSSEFQETFHSSFGAKQEAEVRYIEPCQIKQLAREQSTIRLLDVCYGLGYNSAAALNAIWSVNPQCRIELIALEIAPEVPQEAVRQNLLAHWQQPVAQFLAQLSRESVVNHPLLSAKLLLGDARQTIQSIVGTKWQADAIFFDPFSPPKCPQLWTIEFMTLTARCLSPTGTLATYSCSAAVRTALLEAGLKIGSIVGVGRKSPGTAAGFGYKKAHTLSVKEIEHLKTRAAVPYRDRTLQDEPENIIARRQIEQLASSLEPSSQWKKRWLKLNI